MSERPKKKHKDTHIHNHHDSHYHFLQGIEEEYSEQEKDKKWKKYFIPVVAVVMIMLALSFLLPLERIGSIVESKKINENFVIELNNGKKIFFDENVYNQVRDSYLSSKTEIKICLLGNKVANSYIVDNFYYPKIYESKYDHVISEGCNNETIISLHSHPDTFCIFSAQDIKSYNQLVEYNPNAFIGLICDVDKFNFHGY